MGWDGIEWRLVLDSYISMVRSWFSLCTLFVVVEQVCLSPAYIATTSSE